MKWQIIVRRDARTDLAEAFKWYQRQRGGLGNELVEEVDEALIELGNIPASFPKTHGEIRRIRLSRFPYAIYYIIRKNRVSVIAVLHGSRDVNRILRDRF